jgi:hypothetical protein
MAASVPLWPLCSLFIFEINRAGGEVPSKIAVYYMAMLALLVHVCIETSLLRRRLPSLAGIARLNVGSQFLVTAVFVVLVAIVPFLYAIAGSSIGEKADAVCRWRTVVGFAGYGFLYTLAIGLLFLRVPLNILYLLRLPASPVSIFLSYAQEDHGTMMRIRRQIQEHGIVIYAYEESQTGGEHIDTWVKTHIEKSDIFLVLVSDHSLSSEWVLKEYTYAEDNRTSILPLSFMGVGGSEGWTTILGRRIRERNIIVGDSFAEVMKRCLEAIQVEARMRGSMNKRN